MPADSRVQNLARVMDVVSESYERSSTLEAEERHWTQAAERLRALMVDVPPEFRSSVQYHEARFVALSGDRARAVQLVDALLKVSPPLPETLYLKIQLTHVEDDERSNRRRWELESRVAEILPISPWGRIHDSRLETQEARRLSLDQSLNPELPIIPIIERESLLRIARLYENMKLYDEAANAYREAIYGGFAPPGFPDFGSETWISEQAAEFWMSAARCEAGAGRTRWAVHSLLMAVAPSAKRQLRARSLLESIFDRSREFPAREPDRHRLFEIVNLYRDCNLHPRGLAPLAEAAKLPDVDVADRKSMLERDWLNLIQAYMAGREKICFLFGQQVATVSEKLSLSPKAFPYEGNR